MTGLASPLAFALLLFVGGLVMVFALRRQHAAATALRSRVDRAIGEQAGQSEGARPAPMPSWERTVEAWLWRFFTLGMVRVWGVRSKGATLLVIGSIAGTAAWLSLRLTMNPPGWIVAPAGIAGFFLLPRLVVRYQQHRAEALFAERFPDVIDMIVRMVRAGLPAVAAVRTAGNETLPPVSTVFIEIADQTDIGIPFETALSRTAAGIGLPDFRFFSVAVSLQRSTGGSLTATLEILAEIIRKRRAVRLKARAATGEVRMSAYILGAIPFLVVGALTVMEPRYLVPLFTDPRGNIILGAAVALLVLTAVTMRWMIRSATRI